MRDLFPSMNPMTALVLKVKLIYALLPINGAYLILRDQRVCLSAALENHIVVDILDVQALVTSVDQLRQRPGS